MFLSYLTLAVALSLSVIAAYYSIAGLTAIFAAAVIPIIVMGSILELAKVVVTLWLHEFWAKCKFTLKLYLVPAVVILMVITSMGIFGFLSKAHSDQGMVTGDVQAKISLIDEKIKIERDNIANAREVIKQLDDAVNGINAKGSDREITLKNGTSYTRSAAEQALQVRRSQAKDRDRLTKEIETAQNKIIKLQEEAAPIRAESRKVEAEVGPIKYIAALIYGDNPDANLLERAVRWVIILLVTVFDPLAIMMLLAATESLKWQREESVVEEPKYEQDDGPLTDEQIEQIKESVDPTPPGWMYESKPHHPDTHPYLKQGFGKGFENLKPMVAQPVKRTINDFVPQPQELVVDDEDESVSDSEKAAIRAWKTSNPGETIKHQRQLFEDGKIDRLPWDLHLVADNQPPVGSMRGFGIQWPELPIKGDTFLRVDRLPSALYKYNGKSWIEIDKKISDQYSYDTAYIDHLVSKIDSGEYDPDLLTDAEVEQIQQRFRSRSS